MKTMYEFEHRLVPRWIHTVPAFFNDLVEKGEQKTLYDACKSVFDSHNEEMPYKAEDFGGSHFKLNDKTYVIMMKMPQPEETPLCYRIYMFLDAETHETGCFTVEKGSDPFTGDERLFVCSWDHEGNHQNYGNYYLDDEPQCINLEVRICFSKFRNIRDVKMPLLNRVVEGATEGLICPQCHLGLEFDVSDPQEGDRMMILCPLCFRLDIVTFREGQWQYED